MTYRERDGDRDDIRDVTQPKTTYLENANPLCARASKAAPSSIADLRTEQQFFFTNRFFVGSGQAADYTRG